MSRVMPFALTLFFVATALASATAEYAAVDLALLAVVYALLAACLHRGSVFFASLARPLGLLASLGVGGVLVWHLREQALVPLLGPIAFAAAAAAVGLAYFLVVLRESRRRRPRRAAAAFAGFLALFGVVLVSGYHGSNALRWHLLRHNKLMGTPAYYLLAEPVESICGELWAGHSTTSSPASPVAPETTPGETTPDIAFILVDTLRADSLAAYGGDPGLMPELNRFAEESLIFEDVLANATWTRPSVASFFTGLRPEQHGAVDRQYRLPDERLTLAEVLRSAGYETAAFVANFGAVGRDAGFAQGFDYFSELKGGANPYARADQVNQAVTSWLSRRAGDPERSRRPLFLYVHYLDPHIPYLSGGERPRFLRPHVARRAYEEELRYLDDALRRLLDTLGARLSSPRFVFITSDHGEEFREHGEGGHGHSLYGEVIRLPALLLEEGDEAGPVGAALEARDFFDLIVGLSRSAELDVHEWAVARSRERRYASIYSTTPSAPHRPYRSHVCMRGVEEDDFYLIWSAYGTTHELYDLEGDPEQTKNLERENRDRVAAMLRSMEQSEGRWARRVPVEHTDETVELLRALGYVE